MHKSWLAGWFVLVACSVEEPRDPVDLGESEGPAASCVPGEQRACACPGGAPDGVQICADAGDRFHECIGCPGGGETGTDDGGSGSPTGSGADGESSSGGADEGSSEGGGPPAEGPPDEYDVVLQTAADHPDLLLASCVKTGGNNEFLFEVVRRLRMIDDRWGLNWKRGMVGDLSQDVVDYHWGEGEREESTDVFIIDMITGHCGDDPQPGWIDVTQATLDAGTVGMWTLAGQDL